MLEWFRAKGLEAYSISCGQALLYNNIFPKHKVGHILHFPVCGGAVCGSGRQSLLYNNIFPKHKVGHILASLLLCWPATSGQHASGQRVVDMQQAGLWRAGQVGGGPAAACQGPLARARAGVAAVPMLINLLLSLRRSGWTRR